MAPCLCSTDDVPRSSSYRQARGPNGVTYDRGFTGAAAAAPPPSSASPPVAANRATHQAANASLLRSTSVNRHAYTQDWELHEWRYR